MKKDNPKLLKSKEVQKKLKVRACDIVHLREEGKIRFEKKGNAYLYFEEDVEKLEEED